MSEFSIRAARADDLPRLTQLLPAWALDTAGFVDGDGDEQLLLALTASAPLACLRVQRHVGLGDPRYWFHVGCRVHAASELGMFRRERTLLLGNDHTGAAEIMECVAGGCEYKLAGNDAWVASQPGDKFSVPANSTFEIRVTDAYHYVCHFG